MSAARSGVTLKRKCACDVLLGALSEDTRVKCELNCRGKQARITVFAERVGPDFRRAGTECFWFAWVLCPVRAAHGK